MAYVSMYAPCLRCGRHFHFNPLRVPSMVVDGKREPLCRSCVEWANPIRAAKGLPVWTIHADSYDAVDEQEIPWPDDD
jgi:hypothetical protein